MISSLLAETTNNTQWVSYVILGVMIVAIVVLFVFSGRRRKKQEQEAKSLIDAVKPGNKVKTIGGICGIVVEVDADENTFVLETGTEQSGKCFLKLDRQAIYQTDAVVEKEEESKEEAPAEQAVVETAQTPELPEAAEPVAEEAPAKKTGKKSDKKD